MKSIFRTLWQLFGVLPAGAKPFYVWYSIVTSFLAVLDVIALALITATVTPMVTGGAIQLPLLGAVSKDSVPVLILAVCALFILKSALAIGLHRYATRRFARYELAVGTRLFDAYTHAPWEVRAALSTSDITRIVDISIANTNLGFILPLTQLPGSAVTFLVMLVALFVLQPASALIAVLYLGLVSAIMLFIIARKSHRAGQANRYNAYKAGSVMTEMVEAIKEVTLRNRLDEAGQVVKGYRELATRARADISFFGVVPRYAFEAALIGGFLIVGGFAYISGGMGEAVVAVSIFAVTGFRMIPAMTSVQGVFTNASANIAYAQDVIREVARVENSTEESLSDSGQLPDSPRELLLENVSYNYPGAQVKVLDGISMRIPFGQRIAIVGPSGSGKSTLVDILLGLSKPTEGRVLIDGDDLYDSIRQWRQRVGYVPQKVTLFNGTLAQNVALTWTDNYDEQRVLEALESAQLGALVTDRGGVHEPLGEKGLTVSGGQQQRIGIARALYADPSVIVMDEATSALDSRTEHLITQEMDRLRGRVTFITIAHRLATVRNYDLVCYLEAGKIRGFGTFEELQEQIPEFAEQVALAGIGAES